MMAVVFYKNLGATNEFIGQVTSVLCFAWTLKFIWAPLVDLCGNQARLDSGGTAGAVAHACALQQVPLFLPENVALSVGALALIAFASATQDVAIDGYYTDVLNKQQASGLCRCEKCTL